jgi:hypothetical protein
MLSAMKPAVGVARPQQQLRAAALPKLAPRLVKAAAVGPLGVSFDVGHFVEGVDGVGPSACGALRLCLALQGCAKPSDLPVCPMRWALARR